MPSPVMRSTKISFWGLCELSLAPVNEYLFYHNLDIGVWTATIDGRISGIPLDDSAHARTESGRLPGLLYLY